MERHRQFRRTVHPFGGPGLPLRESGDQLVREVVAVPLEQVVPVSTEDIAQLDDEFLDSRGGQGGLAQVEGLPEGDLALAETGLGGGREDTRLATVVTSEGKFAAVDLHATVVDALAEPVQLGVVCEVVDCGAAGDGVCVCVWGGDHVLSVLVWSEKRWCDGLGVRWKAWWTVGRDRDPATSTSPPRTVQHHASIWDPGASREHLAIRQGAHGDQEGWEYKYRYPVNDVIGGRGGIGARCVCGESVCVGGNGYSRGNFGL